MKTLTEVLQLSTQYLKERGVEAARLSAETLLAHHLKVKRLDLYMQFDRPLLEEELAAFRASLKRRAKGEPVDYILEEMTFLGCSLKVTPAVLIPRPETEVWLSQVSKKMEKGRVLDLCTGSGCLAIGLKKQRPDLEVVASDISSDALAVARENAARNQVDVTFYEGDLLEPLKGQRFDYVLCNPPYISKAEYEGLSPEVRLFEPKGALFAGERGTEFYERLCRELPGYLNPGATCFFEIGAAQGQALIDIFTPPTWTLPLVEKDWAGYPRLVSIRYGV